MKKFLSLTLFLSILYVFVVYGYVYAAQDIESPVMDSFYVDPAPINCSSHSVDVQVVFSLYDHGSGFDHGTVWFSSPTHRQVAFAAFTVHDVVYGNATDGVYYPLVRFPRLAEIGDWELCSVSLFDVTGNSVEYRRHVNINIVNSDGEVETIIIIDPMFEWSSVVHVESY